MKALSVRQPWAWAIIFAGKDIENRQWATAHRGGILIHAAKGVTRREYDGFREFYEDMIVPADWSLPPVPAFDELERGGIIGRATLRDVVTAHSSPWFFGRFGFVLAEPIAMPFRRLNGSLGLFEVERS